MIYFIILSIISVGLLIMRKPLSGLTLFTYALLTLSVERFSQMRISAIVVGVVIICVFVGELYQKKAEKV